MGLGIWPSPLRMKGQGSHQVCLPSSSISFFLLWPLSFADFLFLTQWALVPWELTLGWGKGRVVYALFFPGLDSLA